MKQRIYIYPYEHNNQIIENTKSVFSDLGLDVHPFKHILRPGRLFNRKNNTLVINWLEDQPYRRGITASKRTAVFVSFCLLLLWAKMACAKTIWVRHNFKPHSANSKPRYHQLMCNWLSMLNICPHYLESYVGTHHLLHPLYLKDKSIRALQRRDLPRKENSYLFFGAIKPYKNLHKLIDKWPHNLRLSILGYCSDKHYTQSLQKQLAKRGNISWKNEFVAQSTLNEYLTETDFVLLPHQDNAMVSSGTFYHAISYGCNLICFDSRFAQHKASQHPFVHILNEDQLATDLQNLVAVPKQEVLHQALSQYGQQKILERWAQILMTEPQLKSVENACH